MKARLDKVAAEMGVTLNDLIVTTIEQRLDARDAERAARKRKGQP
jgi:hypothetical protein